MLFQISACDPAPSPTHWVGGRMECWGRLPTIGAAASACTAPGGKSPFDYGCNYDNPKKIRWAV